jgi:hypothetical protein
MKRSLIVCAALAAVLGTAAWPRDATAMSVRLGAWLGVDPDKAAAFALVPQAEWHLGGPVFLAWPLRFAVNGNFLRLGTGPGILVAPKTASHVVPTFQATFLVDWGLRFSHSDNDLTLGASFGPGLRYEFSEAAIFIDVQFEIGRYVRRPEDDTKPLIFAVLPAFGVAF